MTVGEQTDSGAMVDDNIFVPVPRYIILCPSGNRFWVFKDTTLQPSYPQDISLFGSGMPTQSIETAVWWEDVAKTYFFKGDRSAT